MRHEKNAVGVATKMSPYIFFRNDSADVMIQNRIIDEDMKQLFAQVSAGRIVVWPTDGIGTGLSRLPEFAPLTFEHIEAKLAALLRVAKLFALGKAEEAHCLAEQHLILPAEEALLAKNYVNRP